MTGLVADAVLVLQATLVLAVLAGVRRRDWSAVVNGLVALGATVLPATLRIVLRSAAGLDLAYGPELPLWIAVAGLVHAVGMLGPYDSVWWWDHLAHGVSAALVTALTYAAVLVVAENGHVVSLSPLAVVGVTLGFLLLVAVLWELLEEFARYVAERYDVGPLLVVYGPIDAVFDLAFNLVGAGLVILLDVRLFVPMFEPYPVWTAHLLVGAGGVALVSVLLLGGFLARVREDWP